MFTMCNAALTRPRDATELNNDGISKLGDINYQTEPNLSIFRRRFHQQWLQFRFAYSFSNWLAVSCFSLWKAFVKCPSLSVNGIFDDVRYHIISYHIRYHISLNCLNFQSLIDTVRVRQRNWLDYRGNTLGLPRTVLKGKIEGRKTRGKPRMKLLDGIMTKVYTTLSYSTVNWNQQHKIERNGVITARTCQLRLRQRTWVQVKRVRVKRVLVKTVPVKRVQVKTNFLSN